MTGTSLQGRIAGAEAVAVDVVLSSGGEELRRSRRRGPFWLETSSGRVWVEATGLTAVEGARVRRKRGPWSRISQLPEAAGFNGLAIGPHVKVELAVHAIEGGSHVTVTGVLGRRPAAVAQGGDYRSGASEPVLEAKRIDARRWKRQRAKRPPGEPGWAAPAALSIVAGLIVAFMVNRIPLASPFEIWTWSGWWAALLVAGSAVAARRHGYPHIFPKEPFWDFVPQFAEVKSEPARGGHSGPQVGIQAYLVVLNAAFVPVYFLISSAAGHEPPDAVFTVLALLPGCVNHALAWLWLASRLARTRPDARRLEALLEGSRPAWTVREGKVDLVIERHVDDSIDTRWTSKDHGLTQRWSGTHLSFIGSDGTTSQLELNGAFVATGGKLVERTKASPRVLSGGAVGTDATVTTDRWRYDTLGRWLVGYTGLPRSNVAAAGPESLLVFVADAPLAEARLALSRRRATVLALAVTGAAGALATAAHAILAGLIG